jgi:two-component system, response regulator YesN
MNKKRRLWFNNRSVLLTWLLSYLAVLLLPVLMSVIVYVQSSKMLADEIHLANDSLLKQLREMMDKQFQTVDRLNFELTWNVKVRELIDNYKYRSFPQDYMYDLHNVTKDLSLYKSAYSMVDQFYVYMAGRDTVIMPSLHRDSAFAYGELHKSGSFSYDDWLAILRREKFSGFTPMVRLNDSGLPVKSVAYVSTYDFDNGSPAGAKVIMIDQSRILGAINNMEVFSKGHVLIMNENNEVLVSSSDEGLPADFPFNKLTDGSEMFFWKNNGKRYEVFSIESSVSRLRYVSMIPSELYWEKAELVRKLTVMSILFSLGGGGLLTYIFLRRNYNPVQRLMRAFSNNSKVGQDKGLNEFLYIQQAVNSTLSEMDDMALQMKRQHYAMRSHFVMRLLKGKLDNEIPVDESITTFNMHFESDDFAVMVVYTEDNDLFLERIKGDSKAEKLRLLHFIVTNVVEELVNGRHHGYVAEVDDALACLVSFSAERAEGRTEDLMKAAKEAQDFLMSKYNIHLTVSFSSIHTGVDSIPLAYMEAMYAMEYKLVMGKREILPYEEIQKYNTQAESESGYYYPLQVEQQLINFVKVGDFEAARTTLDEIIEHNFRSHSVSVAVARCLMLDLVSTLIKSIGEISGVQENILIQNPKLIEKLTSAETLQDMQSQMISMLSQVCEYAGEKRQQNVQVSRQKALDTLVRDVSDFIEEHYTDPGLNVSLLGQRFEMKPTYLSKLFKDQTGEGLLDALNKRRIIRAKELMADKRLTVAEVAESTGFNDVGTFIRTFKRIEGITPGKYKEATEE